MSDICELDATPNTHAPCCFFARRRRRRRGTKRSYDTLNRQNKNETASAMFTQLLAIAIIY